MKKKLMLLVACALLAATSFAQTWNIGYPNEVDVTATLTDSVLIISGTGEMIDYPYNGTFNEIPWYNYRSNIKYVEIQSGVTNIGDCAFINGFVAFANIANTVTRIGDLAFAYNSQNTLKSIIIPESVTHIRDGAFDASGLSSSITIPASVINIGENVFYQCFDLTAINVDNANVRYNSLDGVLYNKQKDTLLQCPLGKTGAFTIPSSVVHIGEDAFNKCHFLTSVSIPNSVISIGESAFFDCQLLTSVEIPESITSIKRGIFNACGNLMEINVNSNNLQYCSKNGILYNKNQDTLLLCPGGIRGKLILPDTVKVIAEYAFFGSSNITEITLPVNLEKIDYCAFNSCYNITAVTCLNPLPPDINTQAFTWIDLSPDTLYVPASSLTVYRSANVWKDFGTILSIEEMSKHYQSTSSYPHTATFTASVVLNGAELQSGQIEIGVFAENECRGSIVLQNYPEVAAHPYLGFLTVHGNSGENITFKVYNHNADKEYAATNAPIAFTANAIYGEPDVPYTITITDTVTQQILLSAGWSWISTNVSNSAPSLLAQFKQNIGADGVMLKGYNEFIQAPYWVGSLTEINNSSMYMVNISSASVLPFTGLPADPAAHPVMLSNGWNWIGYLPQASLPINEALAGLNPQEGDQIKSYSEYGSYTVANGWVGSLQTLSPGNGYMYFSANTAPQSFLYPFASPENLMTTLRSNEEQITPKWSVANHRFANNMTLTSVVLSDDFELQSDQIEIGAFSGDECRGSVLLKNVSQIADHSYLGFLVVYGENNDDIRLRIYDHAANKEYEADNKLSFVADAILGNPSAPYKILTSPNAINPNSVNDAVISTQYYDLLGKPVTQPRHGAIYIAKELRQSGKTTIKKVIGND